MIDGENPPCRGLVAGVDEVGAVHRGLSANKPIPLELIDRIVDKANNVQVAKLHHRELGQDSDADATSTILGNLWWEVSGVQPGERPLTGTSRHQIVFNRRTWYSQRPLQNTRRPQKYSSGRRGAPTRRSKNKERRVDLR